MLRSHEDFQQHTLAEPLEMNKTPLHSPRKRTPCPFSDAHPQANIRVEHFAMLLRLYLPPDALTVRVKFRYCAKRLE